MNDAVLKVISAFIGILIVTAVFGAILSYPVMLLWNGCLVPAINGFNDVTWLQAWGLTVLMGLLFRGATSGKN